MKTNATNPKSGKETIPFTSADLQTKKIQAVAFALIVIAATIIACSAAPSIFAAYSFGYISYAMLISTPAIITALSSGAVLVAIIGTFFSLMIAKVAKIKQIEKEIEIKKTPAKQVPPPPRSSAKNPIPQSPNEPPPPTSKQNGQSQPTGSSQTATAAPSTPIRTPHTTHAETHTLPDVQDSDITNFLGAMKRHSRLIKKTVTTLAKSDQASFETQVGIEGLFAFSKITHIINSRKELILRFFAYLKINFNDQMTQLVSAGQDHFGHNIFFPGTAIIATHPQLKEFILRISHIDKQTFDIEEEFKIELNKPFFHNLRRATQLQKAFNRGIEPIELLSNIIDIFQKILKGTNDTHKANVLKDIAVFKQITGVNILEIIEENDTASQQHTPADITSPFSPKTKTAGTPESKATKLLAALFFQRTDLPAADDE